jgi:phenylacetate-CoA ligase
LRQHERFSREEIRLLQMERLHRTLQRAIRVLPFYAGISPNFSVFESEDVLRDKFPVISKPDFLANHETLYPNGGRVRPWQAIGKTSGTTGSPLRIFRSWKSVWMENAFLKRLWTWGGYHDGMPCAMLRGDLPVPITRRQPPFWFYNRYNNRLIVSVRHLTESCVDAIIEALDRFRPVMLQAYPSAAALLAEYLRNRNRFLDIPVVFTSSEPLYSHQREAIVERLKCRVMDMYGMAERVALGTECEFGSLHINPDYSYVEILDDNGRPTTDAGWLVGTTFHNMTMPLIRYRLLDQTRWIGSRCACGRAFPLIEPVTGMLEDLITGSHGAVICPSVLTFAFKGMRNIAKSQVAQVGESRWEVRIVTTPEFTPADHAELARNIRTLVDSAVDFEIVYRRELPNTAAGKFRWVVNETRS